MVDTQGKQINFGDRVMISGINLFNNANHYGIAEPTPNGNGFRVRFNNAWLTFKDNGKPTYGCYVIDKRK